MKRNYSTLIWIAVWAVIFLTVPLTMLGQLFSAQSPDTMQRIFSVWKGILPFLLLFAVHHILLIPLVRKKVVLYAVLTAALMACFTVFCFSSGLYPDRPPMGPGDMRGPIRPEIMNTLMGLLLLGVDLGAFFYMENLSKEQRIADLRAESTAQQLRTLQYQINPHFFMNTLNNIHALVDIDPELAKESIEEFSKMMRILLYEGDAPVIPLSREVDFMGHFITLMKLRYPDDIVQIKTDFPEDCGDGMVAPLLYASIVENAFKHGVSYNEPSHVAVKLEAADGRLSFRCSNSRHPSADGNGGGLGLENIKKRLALLYEDDFTLSIDESDKEYTIALETPLKPTHTES